MSGPTKVIVVDPDKRAARQLRLGLSREGVEAVVVEPPADVAALDLPKTGVGVVLVGGADGVAVELVRQARAQLKDVPIVFAGTGAGRSALHAAGADEVIEKPAFLRDVVTVARILSGVASDERDHIVGSLAETTGVFTLVRALSALGRSAVLTLIRGLRRGEVRFYRGEVTSAQVGLIHGQAAFHQLLLWTDARFDFAHEEIVRRQQIPLSSDELFADAERFLDGVRDSAGGLSPAMILEQDVTRVQNLGKQIPTEVHGVLRMFDGHRVLADVLEDSPYRVFETLRVAQKAMEAGLLRPIDGQKPKATWKAVLAIEEWLVGKDTRDAVVERTQHIDSAPISDGTPKKAKKKKGSGNSKKTRKAKTPPAGVPATAKGDIDWGALVPRVIGAEVGPLSGVVPAMGAHGEIEAPTRDKPREGLEALMDTDKRTKIFPTEIGLEPSVVVKGGDTDEWERVELEAKVRVEAEAAAKAAEEKALADKAAAEKAAAEKAAADKAAADKAAADAEAKHARAEAEAKAKEETARAAAAAADEAKVYAAKVKAAAEAKRLEAEKAASEKIATEKAAIAKAKAERLATEEAAAAEKAAADRAAEDKAAAEKAAAEKVAAETAAAAKAAWEAADRAEAREAAEQAATDKAVAEREAADKAAAAMVATPIAAAETASAAMIAKPIAPVEPPLSRDDIVTKETPPLSIAETLSKIETPAPTAIPGALDISPSDGIVRPISTADTAPAGRARRASSQPAHDGPVLKETSGELGGDKRSERTPASSEPSILVSDLQSAHAAAAAALDKVKAAPPPGDSATSSRELEVAQTRKDAVATTETEEAFFSRAERPSQPKIETFDDLDEGYEKPSFWDRVFGRKPKKK